MDASDAFRLAGATALTPTALTDQAGTFTWEVLSGNLVPSGSYYIWAVVNDGKSIATARSAGRVHGASFVSAIGPSKRSRSRGRGYDPHGRTIPQRCVTFTWGRSGVDGDRDLNSDATIELYYSLERADDGGLAIPGGADAAGSR